MANVLEGLLDTDDGEDLVTGSGLAVGVSTTDDGFALAHKPLDTHPAVALLGFTAPEEWIAFGIVTRGTTRPLPATRLPATPLPPGPGALKPNTRIGLVHLVGRDNSSLSRFIPKPGETIELGEGAEGAIHDTCLRVLGLPTAPPPCSPLVYWANCWLQAVAATAAAADAALDWDAAARLHPAIELIAKHEPELVDDAVDQLVGIGRVLVAARPWDTMRQEWATGDGHAGLTAAELLWMDTGCFARWCLGTLADPDRLLEGCAEGLTADALDRLRATLDAWDLPQAPFWQEAEGETER
jgi:hypothetical protein